jgi:hypothetical protein
MTITVQTAATQAGGLGNMKWRLDGWISDRFSPKEDTQYLQRSDASTYPLTSTLIAEVSGIWNDALMGG